MGYIGKVKAKNGVVHLVGSTLYGTCDTSDSVNLKVVVCPDFTNLITGVTIHIKFTYGHSNGNITLDVNDTGPIPVMLYGSSPASGATINSWPAGAVRSFTYDGTNWVMNDFQPGGNYVSYSSYQSLTSAQQTVARTNIGLYRIVLTDVVVSTWVADNTYSDYPFRAAISVSGATSNMIPEVIFSPSDASSGNYAPVSVTSTDVVYIYAKEAGAVEITIPTIHVH